MGTSFVVLAVLMEFQFGGFSGSIPYHCDNYEATVVINGTCPEPFVPISCKDAYPEAFADKPECTYCSVFGIGKRLLAVRTQESASSQTTAIEGDKFCAACRHQLRRQTGSF
jgi:hypothetical protein